MIMFRYGERVVIRDGSKLDCSLEIVYRVKDGQVMVLIDREVNWPAVKPIWSRRIRPASSLNYWSRMRY